MSTIITRSRVLWIGILIVIIVGLLLLPIIGKRIVSTREGTVQDKKSAASSGSMQNQLPNEPARPPASAPSPGEQAGHSMIFRVLDEVTGAGIAGATVTTRKLAETASERLTDPNGQCVVVVEGLSVVLVRAEHYVARALSFLPSDEFPAEYVVRLEKGMSVGGFVRGEDGRPIQEAKINIAAVTPPPPLSKQRGRETIGMLEIITDASGHWDCDELPADVQSIKLSLSHPEYLPCEYGTEQAAGDPFRTIQRVALKELKSGRAMLFMKNGFLITGTVRDQRGNAIENAQVARIDRNMTESGRTTVSTSNGGRFSLAGTGPGRVTLAVQAYGYAPVAINIEAVPGMPPVEIRLDEGQVVRGHVVDEVGHPVIGAQVIGLSDIDCPFPWKGRTDSDGRFFRDSAPAKPLKYGIVAEGFHFEEEHVLEPGKENEIRLRRIASMRISGRVVDSRTNMPIERFKVLASSDNWRGVDASADGKNGEFVLALSDMPPSGVMTGTYSLRVEAEGYRPDLSQSVDIMKGDRQLEIALAQGRGLSGVVRGLGNRPVEGANIFLCAGQNAAGPSGPPNRTAVATMSGMNNVGAPSGRLFNATARSDRDGRFTFDPMPEAHTVVATDTEGFAVEKVDPSSDFVTLDLKPWGRIEGTIRVGSKAAPNQRVTLIPLIPVSRPPDLDVRMSAVSDGEGKFAFPTVPPGDYRISLESIGMAASQSAIGAVRSGETCRVTLGGQGRPVIGRVEVTGADREIDWRRVAHTMALKLPEAQVPSRSNLDAYIAWAKTDEGGNRIRAERQYGFRIESDGSFRVEDVEPGTYIMNILVPPLWLRTEIVVPEIPGGRSDSPLDFGVVKLPYPRKKQEQVGGMTGSLNLASPTGAVGEYSQ